MKKRSWREWFEWSRACQALRQMIEEVKWAAKTLWLTWEEARAKLNRLELELLTLQLN